MKGSNLYSAVCCKRTNCFKKKETSVVDSVVRIEEVLFFFFDGLISLVVLVNFLYPFLFLLNKLSKEDLILSHFFVVVLTSTSS